MLRVLLPRSLLLGLLVAVMPLSAATNTGEEHAILTVFRERLEAASACELGLYLQDQLVARLYQDQSVSLSLPPGEILVSLKTLGSSVCQSAMPVQEAQRILLKAGSVNHFRIGLGGSGPRLVKISADQ